MAVVLVTALAGFLAGIRWAFVAGVTANLLVGDPLGSVPLTMLLVSVIVAGGARIIGRMIWIYPVLAVFAGSIVADLTTLAIARLVSTTSITGVPLDLVLGAATLNAAMAALVLYPVRVLLARYATEEPAAW